MTLPEENADAYAADIVKVLQGSGYCTGDGVLVMSLKVKLKEIRDNYVINQVQRLRLPEFAPDSIRRYSVIFSGRVQKVGFRLEVCELAKRLGVTGFCRNLENGDVMAQLQGPENRITYLISFMEPLKRIKIENKVIAELEVDEKETEFLKQ